ncbi:hypothetical protein BUALT_Bualt07G0086200 [Buddleja alternifolia]|uniref:DUF7950 domain-containing protein n=1 Tax=Buddleja alternifolia TaxID=168488 RepID=A0AAV6X9D3_9LAMI|nr:hypothetical protein BUALT_Bualt07G0086200 [Buddleja alternifolia]
MNPRGGGCCIARYGGGAYDTSSSKVDRIMLRFRPIAPKPTATTTNGSFSGGSSPENSQPSVKIKTAGRGKRKHAAKDCHSVNKMTRCGISRKTKASPEKTTDSGRSVLDGCEKAVKTLSFLPETPDAKLGGSSSKESFPLWLSFGGGGHVRSRGMGHVGSEVGRRMMIAGSWVKVECVTETWVLNSYGPLGRTDEEKVRSIEMDTCPGFVSDGLNRVRWTNDAYRRMVVGEEAAAAGEVGAWLVVEEGVALPPVAGFTCRVRVVTCGKEKNCKTVPCDVWRMDCGGFAWRLDTAAALSLWVDFQSLLSGKKLATVLLPLL